MALLANELRICSGYNKPKATGMSGAVSFYVNKDSLKCNCKATLFENNKWYCKRHAPSEKLKREEKRGANKFILGEVTVIVMPVNLYD